MSWYQHFRDRPRLLLHQRSPAIAPFYHHLTDPALSGYHNTFILINLRLILVCGKTEEFLFNPSDSAGEIAQYVFDNWPEGPHSEPTLGDNRDKAKSMEYHQSMSFPHSSIHHAPSKPKPTRSALTQSSHLCFDWAEEAVARAEILRLIYQGRFLHSNVTLGALGLPYGRTTVMHLVPRENLPEPNSQDQRQKSKGGGSSCCSASCSIL
ncbi:unnamed protein product [Nezara viridula]|uniref:UBL3-like ubiquitin domain-containing protein n=1 Tax=Nezara viridula TaxID=85310 RepID=A0A9P0H2X0_NEZVI|nr:unnamed protein product [Nezara viridula]